MKIIILNGYFYAGGTIVLSELCRTLCRLGYDARIMPVHRFPVTDEQSSHFRRGYIRTTLKTIFKLVLCRLIPLVRLKKAFDWEYYHPRHFKGCKKSYFPFLGKKDYIIVYPETVYGNPFNAKYVIRWVLYHYNYLGDRRAYSDLDLFVPYRDIFTDKVPRTAEKNVKVAFFDMMLYHRTNFGKRKGNCYIVRKGHNRADLPKEFDGPVVDDFSEEEKVRIFNECEYCYSYDMQTAYSAIAALCGCKSIVVPEPGKIRSDYYSGEDKCYGVAFGDSPEELARAESTLPLLSAALDYSERNIQAAKNMIENIEKGFNISVGK